MRSGVECRIRWLNHLSPSIRKQALEEEEAGLDKEDEDKLCDIAKACGERDV